MIQTAVEKLIATCAVHPGNLHGPFNLLEQLAREIHSAVWNSKSFKGQTSRLHSSPAFYDSQTRPRISGMFAFA